MATSVAATILFLDTRRGIGEKLVIRSFEPGEAWFWDYATNDDYDGPHLPRRGVYI